MSSRTIGPSHREEVVDLRYERHEEANARDSNKGVWNDLILHRGGGVRQISNTTAVLVHTPPAVGAIKTRKSRI